MLIKMKTELRALIYKNKGSLYSGYINSIGITGRSQKNKNVSLCKLSSFSSQLKKFNLFQIKTIKTRIPNFRK